MNAYDESFQGYNSSDADDGMLSNTLVIDNGWAFVWYNISAINRCNGFAYTWDTSETGWVFWVYNPLPGTDNFVSTPYMMDHSK